VGRMLILLCESPFQREAVDQALEIARAALAKGHHVDVYLMMDGVYNPLTAQNGEPFHVESVSHRISELMEVGAKFSGCRVCMELRGVSSKDVPAGMDIGGIFDLSESLAEADTVISYTGAS